MGGAVRRSFKKDRNAGVGGLTVQGTRSNDPVNPELLAEEVTKDPTRPEDQARMAAAEEKRLRKAAKLKK